MPIRIKHHDKNYATTQQLEISLVMPEEIPFCRCLIPRSEPCLSVIMDQYKHCYTQIKETIAYSKQII